MTKRFPIINRRGQRIFMTRLDAIENARSAFVLHGYSGCSDEPHIRLMGEEFQKAGFAVRLIDAANSFNDADGEPADNTIETHLHDLEDVIAHEKAQGLVKGSYALAGHSLGGFAILLYAEKHADEVCLLAPISTVVSGKLLHQAYETLTPEKFHEIHEKGFQIITSGHYRLPDGSLPQSRRPLSWITHMEAFNVLPLAKHLKMPVLLITGDSDDSTPVAHHQLLFDALPGKKEFHIFKDADHCFTGPGQLETLRLRFSEWLRVYA